MGIQMLVWHNHEHIDENGEWVNDEGYEEEE